MRLAPFLLLAVLPAAGKEPAPGPAPVDGKAIVEHIKWLADDERSGRAAGSDGARAAADYVAARFKAIGLEPAGDDKTYFQDFTLPRGFKIEKETSLTAERDGKSVTLNYDKDFKPLSLSGPGDVKAAAVFAGYGVAAPDLGYDDYEGIDVKGKVVICLRGTPGEKDRKSPFASPRIKKRYGAFQAKVSTAVGAGAAALVIINVPNTKPKADVPLHAVGGKSSAIPVFHVTYRAGKRLAKRCRLNLKKEQLRIEKSRAPNSRVLEGVAVRVNAVLKANVLPVRNVCGILRAGATAITTGKGKTKAAAARETLVVGAHFDHVGLGSYGSLAGSKGKGAIHNGADDNASGTSSLLELAAWMAAQRPKLKRDVLFLLFTAEELGLLGSKHYVGAPVVPLAQCVAMVNLDMVGRLKDGKLQVGGTGTSPVFPDLLKPLVRRHKLGKVKFNPGGRAPSDNT
ncbi:MAG: M28 family peptidase, partial [Planctomycetota bacterium]|nr:M28 family peptidase [Planctomycetota bacterium]